jgi:DNA-binding response OmpR family regulator
MASVDARPSALLVDSAGASRLVPVVDRCGFAATWASSPEEAMFELGQRDFGVVVAVLPLAGLGISGLCDAIRMRGRIPLLVISSSETDDWVAALANGADDLVREPFDERELRARLRSLMRRVRGPLSPRRVVRVGELVVRLGRGVVALEPALALTPVQLTMLGYLAAQPGVVLSERALADGVQAAHGPMSDVGLDAELRGLQAAVDVAAGVDHVLEHIDGAGWRMRTGGG